MKDVGAGRRRRRSRRLIGHTGLMPVGHNSRIHLESRWGQRKARKVAVVGRGRPRGRALSAPCQNGLGAAVCHQLSYIHVSRAAVAWLYKWLLVVDTLAAPAMSRLPPPICMWCGFLR